MNPIQRAKELGYDVSLESSKRDLMDAKHIVRQLLREEGKTLYEIAELTGVTDHSTICTSLQRYKELIEYDSNFQKLDQEFRCIS